MLVLAVGFLYSVGALAPRAPPPSESLTMSYPASRPRRLRRTPALRALVRETILTPRDFVYPIFVCPGRNVRVPIASMPGQARLSPDLAAAEAKRLHDELGVASVLLFGIPEHKDAVG